MAEFTADELATLRRFEESPFAPEARYRDMNPLVPDGEIRPSWEVVPHPDLCGGTAEEWSRHYLAEAYAHHGLAHHLLRKADFGRVGDAETVQQMAEAYERMADSFAIGFLMRHVTDDIAQQLGELLEMGETDEVTWEWLTAAGINPHTIRSTATHTELVAQRGRLMAERHAAASAEADQ